MSLLLVPRLVASITATCVLSAASAAQCLVTTDVTVDGERNPFLAGQPDGTQVHGDVAPDQSPLQLPLGLVGDELIRFAGVGGLVSHTAASGQPGSSGPDGDDTLILDVPAALGLAGLRMPAGALLGVFLSDTTNTGTAPGALDFTTAPSRDFDRLSPALFQPFFVGNGLREDGTTLQEFEVPAGATRLFLGIADTDGWASNGGAFDATVEQEVADITEYCTAKVTSEGCLPTIGYTGYPTLTGTHAFDVVCGEITPGKRGTLFYGRAVYNVPFQGGYLCTNVLIKRTPIVKSPPSASGLSCSSSFSFDFNAWILSGNDPTLVPGETIYAQWWMRDSGAWSSTGLSDAIEIQLCQ